MKLFRASGKPIKEEHQASHLKELNEAMDALEAKLGKCTMDSAEIFSEELEKVHRDLSCRYPTEIDVNCPRRPDKLKKFIEEYAGKKGAVAFCIEDDQLTAYILDQ